MSVVFRTVDPLGFYLTYLDQKIRPDGRDLKQFREICLNTGSINTACGSAIVKFGNTTVICGTKAELAPPPPDEPQNGFIVPNLDLPPLCSSRFKVGPPGEMAQSLTQLMKDVIESSGCLLPEDLCIEPGKLSWCLFVDIICLNYDGNIVDAAILAMMAALKTTFLPTVTFDDKEEVKVDTKKKIPLKVHSTPAASTCFFINTEMMVDPTDEEEKLADGTITYVLQAENGNICYTLKPGGLEVTTEVLDKCIDIAKSRTKSIGQLIHTKCTS